MDKEDRIKQFRESMKCCFPYRFAGEHGFAVGFGQFLHRTRFYQSSWSIQRRTVRSFAYRHGFTSGLYRKAESSVEQT